VEIRRLHWAEGLAIRAIARRLGISRNTVKKDLVAYTPPCYERAPQGSIVDAVEPAIPRLLVEFPDRPRPSRKQPQAHRGHGRGVSHSEITVSVLEAEAFC
jgi:hypothetical protein